MLERRALALDIQFDVLGVSATVTRPLPDDTPIETRGIWVGPGSAGSVPVEFDVRRNDRRRVIALKVSEVPTVPKGTRIVMAERSGGAVLTWRVDGTEYADADHRRVIVVPETEP